MANTENAQTTEKPITVRLLMWEISSALSDRLFPISNLVLIVGAAAVLIGTIGTIVMSGVRERFGDERISANEARAAVAGQEAAKANEAAAILRAQNLALEKIIAPRRLTVEQQRTIADALSSFSPRRIKLQSYASDVEAGVLGGQIKAALVAAHLGGVDALYSVNGFGNVSFGIHVTGEDSAFVSAIITALRNTNLAVSSDAPTLGGAAVIAEPVNAPKVDATVFVGVKPIE
jgi:hypothetical protein